MRHFARWLVAAVGWGVFGASVAVLSHRVPGSGLRAEEMWLAAGFYAVIGPLVWPASQWLWGQAPRCSGTLGPSHAAQSLRMLALCGAAAVVVRLRLGRAAPTSLSEWAWLAPAGLAIAACLVAEVLHLLVLARWWGWAWQVQEGVLRLFAPGRPELIVPLWDVSLARVLRIPGLEYGLRVRGSISGPFLLPLLDVGFLRGPPPQTRPGSTGPADTPRAESGAR